jgi:hypothetical protein
MSYGHAERNLALIRQLEAETRQLLVCFPDLDQEQPAWPNDPPGALATSAPRHNGLMRSARRDP